MAQRYKPAPHAYDPWEERFRQEAKRHTRDPFPSGRKGEPMHPSRRKERPLKGKPQRGTWSYR